MNMFFYIWTYQLTCVNTNLLSVQLVKNYTFTSFANFGLIPPCVTNDVCVCVCVMCIS